jgi:hypothetical protein
VLLDGRFRDKVIASVIDYMETNDSSSMNYQIVLDLVQELLNCPQKSYDKGLYPKLIALLDKVINNLQ